jgi:hypothetical protein
MTMKKLVYEWSIFIQEYGWKKILNAFLGGFVFATLAIFPLYIIFAEVLMLLSYLKELWFALIFITAIGHIALINALTLKALLLKQPQVLSHPKWVISVNAGYWMAITLLIGIIFIVVFIPILWV